MDKHQAQEIIRETFESPFDKSSFTGFIKNLLNRIEDTPFTYHGQFIPDTHKDFVNKYERIGKYFDGENRIDILVVYLKKGTSVERARTKQRNFVAGYLLGKYGSSRSKDAALVAYISPDKEDWRFSLVKVDYVFDENGKVIEEKSPARRWSFLVGANEKSHTAQSRLVKILVNDEHYPTLKEIEKAFDIETVTEEFFLEYRGLFLRTKEELDNVVKNDPKIKTDFEVKGVDTVNFAKKLLGQIIFLYFLQKKGWFGVGRDNAWGTGSKHFLRELFEGKHGPYKNFFNDILEPLFYDALSRDRSDIDHWNDQFKCKIPFLNGGLFDPIGNYSWYNTDILLPNKLFSNNVKTKEGDTGTGILDIFDRYNFTVKEDEPLEKEVAIDPELLGKAYEKFNAVRLDNFKEFKKTLKSGKTGEENKFNKKFGVYYTPREIVHYMCQQSLINYLHTELNNKVIFYQKIGEKQTIVFGNEAKKDQLDLTSETRTNPIVSKEEIEIFIKLGEQIGENEETALIKEQCIKEGKQKTSDYKLKLPESIRKNPKLIDDKLAKITICDPAVGSGAFPVGMMNEIVRARNVLFPFIQNKNRTPYEFKRRCIEHSLYGVDIDPGAVEIAKLRLWLSLVVDEDDIKNIKPLPNLDYKIVCGNSLLGVEKNLFNLNLFNELENLKPLFFNETNPTKKQEYKKQIDKLISEITSGHTEFDFEVYFSEVFHNKGGFDVVIANPPYISYYARRSAKLDTKTLRYYQRHYDFIVDYKLDGKFNEAMFFLELGINLLNDLGSIIYILDISFHDVPYRYIRNYILQHTTIKQLVNGISVFASVVSDQLILLLQKENDLNKRQDNKIELFKSFRDKGMKHVSNYIVVDQLYWKSTDRNQFIAPPDRTTFSIISKFESHKKIKDLYPGKLVRTCMSLAGHEDDFLIENNKSQNKPIFKYLHNGKCLPYRYAAPRTSKYVVYNEALRDNLNKYYRKDAYNEIRRQPKALGLGSLSAYKSPKLFVRQSADKIIATYTAEQFAANTSFYIIGEKDNKGNKCKIPLKYLLSVINSKLLTFCALKKEYIKTGQKKQPQMMIKPFKSLFIAIAADQNQFIEYVNKILAITADKDYLINDAKRVQVYGYEQEIDRMVYELYGLTKKEIRIVEDFKKT